MITLDRHGHLMPGNKEEAAQLLDGSFRGIYGNPDVLGTEARFDLLGDALAWANRDGGGIILMLD
jgi:hypothetical protein